MSELTTAARPYARAVFEMAKSTDSLTKWSDSLAFMGSVSSNDDVKALLSTPAMAKQAGGEAFIKLCDGKLGDAEKNLVNLLAENDRLFILPEIAKLFEALKDDSEGTLEALVTSAQKLTQAEEEAISKALKKRLGRDIKLKVSVDESLLGGAIIRAGDLVMDGSLKGRLNKMTASMVN